MKNRDNEPRLLETVADTAHMLNVSLRTVYNLAESGDLDLVKLGKATRITTASIRRLIKRRAKPLAHVKGLRQYATEAPVSPSESES